MRKALLVLGLLAAGCASDTKPEPGGGSEPAAEVPPQELKPDPLGRKLFTELPTANQARECARKVPVALDLGGWELRHWPVRDAEDPVSVELLYAVRGDEVRAVGKIDDIAVLVDRYRSADDLRELLAVVDRERAAGVEFWEEDSQPLDAEAARRLAGTAGLEEKISFAGGECFRDRVLMQRQFGDVRIVRIRETFAPRSYAVEVLQVLERTPCADRKPHTLASLQREGKPADTKFKPGGWDLWIAPIEPDSMDSPTPDALFAVKDGEIRPLYWMEDIAALAGPLETGADALEACLLPARLDSETFFAFDESHGRTPEEEEEYLADVKDRPGEPSVESVPGGWSVEMMLCQFAGIGQQLRAAVVRFTLRDGHVRMETVRIVKTCLPLLRAYQ